MTARRDAMVVLPALLGERDAAHYLGISASTLRTLGLSRRRLGARRLYDRRDLDAYVDGLPYEGDQGCADADQAFGCAG